MTSSKTLIFTLAVLATLAFAAENSCLLRIDGYIFNLCPLYPVVPLYSPDYGEPAAFNASFSLFTNASEPCRNKTDTRPVQKERVWLSATNQYGECFNIYAQPTYNLTYVRGQPAIDVNYGIGMNLRIICNSSLSLSPYCTEPRFSGQEYENVIITTSSFSACPVKDPHGTVIRIYE